MTDYSLIGHMNYFCADGNFNWAFYSAFIMGIFDVFLVIFTWIPFANYYKDMVDWQKGTGYFSHHHHTYP